MTPSEIKRLFGIDISTIHDREDKISPIDEVSCESTELDCDPYTEIEDAAIEEIIEETLLECDWEPNGIDCVEIKTPKKCKTIPGYMPQGNVTNNITIINKASNYLLVNFSEPENSSFVNTTSYQNNILKGVDVLEYIIINNSIETKEKGDFTFNSSTGELDRSPNVFTTQDVLIINYNK